MPSKQVRIETELLAKIATIAAKNGRKIKAQMEMMIRKGMGR